jgi:CRP-like cAMP-binding protein
MQSSDGFENRLLRALPHEELEQLRPHLEPVSLEKGDVLSEPDTAFESVHFLEAGIGSIVVLSQEGHLVEGGLFGRDGFTPIALALGAASSPHKVLIQGPGRGHRVHVGVFRTIMDDCPELRRRLLLFAQTLLIQASHTALSNAVHSIDERLARWLLMCHDRVEGDELHLTHEFMSLMLAVRRPSVTTALHVLEGNRFIRADRGVITIRDRKRLEDFARDAYGRPEAEYEKLLGPLR